MPTAPPSFAIDLDDNAIRGAARAFARDGFVQVRPILAEADAAALHHHLAHELEWWRVVNQGERTWDIGPESLVEMSREGGGQLLELVHRRARDGFQFLFDAVRVSDHPAERRGRGWTIDALIDALNAPYSLQMLSRLIGQPSARMVDGQATRYLPGHFLTGHDDAIEGKGRLAAYVLNLTPEWRTEWGGMLLFHDDQGNVTRGVRPAFNALNLFRVPQRHSVSLVTPFAGAARYAVTGWIRA